MRIDWLQVVATLFTNTLFLAALGFIAKKFVERWIDRSLERYKSELRQVELEHGTKFALLHEKRAAIIAELYRSLVQMLRSMNQSAQGIHQWADDQVPIPRETRQALSVQYFNTAIQDFRSFERYCEDNRIYLSDELIGKLDDLREQLIPVLRDLETSHSPTPPGLEGLPPSIRAIWDAQKKLRLLVDPIKEEIETEFRRILGVIESAASK